MNWSPAEYDRACRDYDRKWAVLDQALYGLCKRCPNHRRRDWLNAKLWIVGRAYATGIERKVPSEGRQGEAMSKVADHLWRHRRRLDGFIRRLSQIRQPLSPGKLRTVLAVHGQFVALLEPKMTRGQSPRSFASKYLHFHCPAVPLYDTFALRALTNLYPLNRCGRAFVLPLRADEEYGRYVLRFWWLYQDARKRGRRVTVKLLDYYLLCVAEEL